MAISWTDVTGIAPGLSTVPLASQTKILAIVERWVDVGTWGEFADDGKTYLAAHLASIRANAGMVNSETLGPMSRSYGGYGGDADGWLGLSTYGITYRGMLRIAMGPIAFVP